jgi:hypothetical protein
MLLHLNEVVQVRLTDRGRSLLEEVVEEDSNGWSEWTLWRLMATFGDFLSPDQEEPFYKIKVLA